MSEHGEPEVVFEGSMMEVDIVRSMLAARGIETFIEDESAATTYPLGRAHMNFVMSLLCPAGRADEAREILAEIHDEEE